MQYLNSNDKELEIGDQVSVDINSMFNIAVILRFDALTPTFDGQFPDGSVVNIDVQLVRQNLTGQLRQRERFLHDVVDMLTDI